MASGRRSREPYSRRSLSVGDVAGTFHQRLDDPRSENPTELECPICLQACLHPVKLPCNHIFCYLCVKGVALQNKRCALCRREIPYDYLDNPVTMAPDYGKPKVEPTSWFYEGRNGGYWQYDDRTAREIESAFNEGRLNVDILVAGSIYVVDFESMVQLRRSDPSRRRRILRGEAALEVAKKGVAGLRYTEPPVEAQGSEPVEGETAGGAAGRKRVSVLRRLLSRETGVLTRRPPTPPSAGFFVTSRVPLLGAPDPGGPLMGATDPGGPLMGAPDPTLTGSNPFDSRWSPSVSHPNYMRHSLASPPNSSPPTYLRSHSNHASPPTYLRSHSNHASPPTYPRSHSNHSSPRTYPRSHSNLASPSTDSPGHRRLATRHYSDGGLDALTRSLSQREPLVNSSDPGLLDSYRYAPVDSTAGDNNGRNLGSSLDNYAEEIRRIARDIDNLSLLRRRGNNND